MDLGSSPYFRLLNSRLSSGNGVLHSETILGASGSLFQVFLIMSCAASQTTTLKDVITNNISLMMMYRSRPTRTTSGIKKKGRPRHHHLLWVSSASAVRAVEKVDGPSIASRKLPALSSSRRISSGKPYSGGSKLPFSTPQRLASRRSTPNCSPNFSITPSTPRYIISFHMDYVWLWHIIPTTFLESNISQLLIYYLLWVHWECWLIYDHFSPFI